MTWEDAVFDVKSSLVVALHPNGKDVAGRDLSRVDYDFVLDPV
jgi:hypothetical protein